MYQKVLKTVWVLLLACSAGWVNAEAPGKGAQPVALDLTWPKRNYGMGVDQHQLDSHTRVLGWRLQHGWYFGRQRGDDSGLTLVWQQGSQQFSVSKDGLRLTRRF